MDDLLEWLRAQLDEDRAVLLRYRDGHDGPCLNYEGQDPADYSDYDSCALHLEAAEGTPYRDADFGLREIDTKRQLVELHHAELIEATNADGDERSGYWCFECDGEPFPCRTLRLLAMPFADRPGYREEWRS